MSQVDKFELSDDAYAQRTGACVATEADASLNLTQIRFWLTNSAIELADLPRKPRKMLRRSPIRMSRLGLAVKSSRQNKISTNVALFDLLGAPSLAKELGSALSTMNP